MSYFGTLQADRKSYKYSNDFIYKWETSENKGEIFNPKSDIVYRGNIVIDNNNLDTACINLINYHSNLVRKIMLNQMEVLPDNIMVLNDNVITVSSLPLKTCVQIVVIPSFYESDFDTNSVEIEIISTTDPFCITLPKSEYPVDYVIWIDNKCKKIRY